MKLINNTNKAIRCCTRLNGRWWDGLLPGDIVITDEPHKIRALMKHGCTELKESKKRRERKSKRRFEKVKKVIKDARKEKG